MSQAVVVTGIGVVSPLGNDLHAFFDALMQGRSGLRKMGNESGFDQPVVAGVADFDPAPWFNKLQLSGVDRVSQFAVAAATMARTDAALDATALDDAAIYFGTGMGGAFALEQAFGAHFSERPRVSPLTVVASMNNAAAGHIAMRFGVHGAVFTYSVACASSAIAIGEAYRAVQRGDVDIAIAGGAEALLTPGVVRAWQAMQTLASTDGEHPETACRPFSTDRSGLALAEGAAVLILESEAHAKARGARIYAELAGYGVSCDATHITKPDAAGQVRAMRAALRSANLTPTDIGYCNAHGTATKVGDVVECEALNLVWGDAIDQVTVGSTKSMHGHMLGGAGAIEAAITALAIHHRAIPPTANCTEQDAACAVRIVRDKGVAAPGLKAAISNSFAFGGSNAALIFKQTA
ncbi:MAG: beta-ketoacyl-[acyl-carrier-protein] synthase family protein [Burkholderiales bacterium]|nr:beta-ketoacyl-[acyl-carrier-protein] synthase family protein [Burkholderiales bacterium]